MEYEAEKKVLHTKYTGIAFIEISKNLKVSDAPTVNEINSTLNKHFHWKVSKSQPCHEFYWANFKPETESSVLKVFLINFLTLILLAISTCPFYSTSQVEKMLNINKVNKIWDAVPKLILSSLVSLVFTP